MASEVCWKLAGLHELFGLDRSRRVAFFKANDSRQSLEQCHHQPILSALQFPPEDGMAGGTVMCDRRTREDRDDQTCRQRRNRPARSSLHGLPEGQGRNKSPTGNALMGSTGWVPSRKGKNLVRVTHDQSPLLLLAFAPSYY